jgi:hypothetical protein
VGREGGRELRLPDRPSALVSTHGLRFALSRPSHGPHPSPPSLPFLRSYCRNCYAYLGGEIKLAYQFKWASLQSFELKGTLKARFAVDIQVNVPSANGVSSSSTVEVWPGGGRFQRMATFSVLVAGVPIPVDIDGKVSLGTTVTAAKQAQVTGPGFWFDDQLSLGVKYSLSGGWQPINERSLSFQQRTPSWTLSGSLTIRATPMLTLRFGVFKTWPIDIVVKPWLSATATPGSGCSSGSGAVSLSGGLDLDLVIQAPRVAMTILGRSYTFQMPGSWPVTFPMTILRR